MRYKRPKIKTFNSSDLMEIMGPGCAASGTLNMDMYRGTMLEKTYEYRLAEKVDLGMDGIEKVQEVHHA